MNTINFTNFTKFYKVVYFFQYFFIICLIVSLLWISTDALSNLYRPIAIYLEVAKYIAICFVVFASFFPEKYILDRISLRVVDHVALDEKTALLLNSVGLTSQNTQVIAIEDPQPNIFLIWTPLKSILLYTAPVPTLLNNLDFEASLAYFQVKWTLQSPAITTAYMLLISIHYKYPILRPIATILSSMIASHKGYGHFDLLAGRITGNMIGYRKMLELLGGEFIASNLSSYMSLVGLIDVAVKTGEISQEPWSVKMRDRVKATIQ